jgi:hypothetical protein
MLRRVLIAALLGALVAPAAATAATVSKVDAATLRYAAAPGVRDLLNLSITDAGTKILFDMSNGADPAVSGVGCDAPSGGDVKCTAAGITRVIVALADGDDVLNFSVPAEFAVTMSVDGGPGADGLRGGSQADVIAGGEGGDFITLGHGADDVSGGPGFDAVRLFPLSAATVSLDDVANDGQGGALQGANIHADVENLSGTAGDDLLIGSDFANELDGGAGGDTLIGRGGLDFYTLGIGDDTADARDGLGERVLCGAGEDTVTSDDIDDLGDACEHVSASGELVRDLDKDGIAKPEDCNDADPAIRPGAADTPNDGIDQDCDGADAIDRDRDRDGVAIPFDCDDSNPLAAPGASATRSTRTATAAPIPCRRSRRPSAPASSRPPVQRGSCACRSSAHARERACRCAAGEADASSSCASGR